MDIDTYTLRINYYNGTTVIPERYNICGVIRSKLRTVTEEIYEYLPTIMSKLETIEANGGFVSQPDKTTKYIIPLVKDKVIIEDYFYGKKTIETVEINIL